MRANNQNAKTRSATFKAPPNYTYAHTNTKASENIRDQLQTTTTMSSTDSSLTNERSEKAHPQPQVSTTLASPDIVSTSNGKDHGMVQFADRFVQPITHSLRMSVLDTVAQYVSAMPTFSPI